MVQIKFAILAVASLTVPALCAPIMQTREIATVKGALVAHSQESVLETRRVESYAPVKRSPAQSKPNRRKRSGKKRLEIEDLQNLPPPSIITTLPPIPVADPFVNDGVEGSPGTVERLEDIIPGVFDPFVDDGVSPPARRMQRKRVEREDLPNLPPPSTSVGPISIPVADPFVDDGVVSQPGQVITLDDPATTPVFDPFVDDGVSPPAKRRQLKARLEIEDLQNLPPPSTEIPAIPTADPFVDDGVEGSPGTVQNLGDVLGPTSDLFVDDGVSAVRRWIMKRLEIEDLQNLPPPTTEIPAIPVADPFVDDGVQGSPGTVESLDDINPGVFDPFVDDGVSPPPVRRRVQKARLETEDVRLDQIR